MTSENDANKKRDGVEERQKNDDKNADKADGDEIKKEPNK